MSLEAGSRLGPYEIESPLGAGGMGEVYRARDTRLERTVAVKVLPGHLAENADLRARFEREARAASSLNHAHICAVYDVGEHEGTAYLVMEHLEGETLSARLERGPLGVEDALPVAMQIADALDAAHRGGLIHRDLKPGNVMLTPGGAKVLDFGLAKGIGPGGGATSLTAAPTAASPLTTEGTLIGTFQYMSPEQLEGKEADARSDVFAFGALLYEMITGRRAFLGDTQASVIARILETEPPPASTIAPSVPPALDRVAQTCLAKNPAERRQSMHDVLLDLRWIAERGPEPAAGTGTPRAVASSSRLPWMLVAVLVLVAAASTWAWLGRGNAPAPTVRSFIPAPDGTDFYFVGQGPGGAGPVVLSPDGSRMAFVARNADDGVESLWVRRLDSTLPVELSGTRDARYPFWSPDSRHLAFFSQGKLRKVEATGGPPLALCDAPDGRSGTWNDDGVIVFAPDQRGPLHRVPASGGASEAITSYDDAIEDTHRWPWFLPDGHHFLYFVRFQNSAQRPDEVRLGTLDDPDGRMLFASETQATYASGHLLYVQDRTLMARPFDTSTQEARGDAFPLAENVQVDGNYNRGIFSASTNGILVYATGNPDIGNRLLWYDHDGQEVGAIGERVINMHPDISPDGARVVAQITHPVTGADLWVHDLERSLTTRFTFGKGASITPVWSPDGTEIAFTSSRENSSFDIYRKSFAGTGDAALVFQSKEDKFLTDWSRDGRFLAYTASGTQTEEDVWVLPLAEGGEPMAVVQTEFMETEATFSPDGQWIAYRSDASGRSEIYVTPFPGPGRKWQVSIDSGRLPQWRADGKELFFLSLRSEMMAAEVDADEGTFQVGPVRKLFEFTPGARFKTYDPAADGQRFLVIASGERLAHRPMTLVVNWTSELPAG